MNKLINKNSYLNVKGWTNAEVRDAARIFFESVDECADTADIGVMEGYHYMCFIEEKGELRVFVGTKEVTTRHGAVELTEEQVFGTKDVPWDGTGNPPAGTLCKTQFGRKVNVVGYMEIGNAHVVVVQDALDEIEIDWVLPEILEPLKDEKQEEIDRIAKEVLNSVNLIGQDFCHDELGVAKYLYDSGLRFTEEDEDDSY